MKMHKVGQKQAWFFRDAETELTRLKEGDFGKGLERQELKLGFTVWRERGYIQIYVRSLLRDEEVVWSTPEITNIVDYDIAVEELKEWARKPEKKKDDPGASVAPDSPKTTGLAGDLPPV